MIKHLSFAPEQQYSSMATSLHWSHSRTQISQLFLYSWFTVLLSSCLSSLSFLWHLYTREKTRFTFENKSQTVTDNFTRFKVSLQIHSFQLIKLDPKECVDEEQVN